MNIITINQWVHGSSQTVKHYASSEGMHSKAKLNHQSQTSLNQDFPSYQVEYLTMMKIKFQSLLQNTVMKLKSWGKFICL